MIVRRIREHLGERDWLAVLLDLAIAILGVFIGIQVANWNEARGERAQSHEDRQRLIADLDSNRADYANRAQYYAAVQDHAQAALSALDQPLAMNGETFLIDAYQATQIIPRPAKRTTYDEIVSTGRLTRLADAAVRDRVGSYYIAMTSGSVIFDYVPPYRERLRRAMAGSVQRAIRRHCREDVSFLRDGTALFSLAKRCTLGLDPATVVSTARAVRAIPDLRGELNRVIGDTDGKREVLLTQEQQAQSLREQLIAADEGR